MTVRALFAACCLLAAVASRAQPFPARSGEAGILDVPDAEVLGPGGGQLGVELRFDRISGQRSELAALPLYVVAGVARPLDLGLTMREWGQPGDPRPARMAFGAAAKLQLWAPSGPVPGAAISATLDRFNEKGLAGLRLVTSTRKAIFRLAAFVGFEALADGFGDSGIDAGIAASLALLRSVDLAAEAVTGPRGENFGAAVRWTTTRTLGLSLGVNYFPADRAFRTSVTLAFAPAPRQRAAPTAPEEAPVPPTPEAAAPSAPRFAYARPRFRLRLPTRGPALLSEARHLQHGPPSAAGAGTPGPARPEAPGVRPAAPRLEELAEQQLREQEAMADARARRIRTTSEQLDLREKAALEEQRRLEEAERDLASREQQLESRERRIAFQGPPSQQLRQLEGLEAQLSSQERNLSAQERSFGPAIDAADGRERDAAAREDAERQEANRLIASVAGAATRALQLEIRKQAFGSRNRQLAALEARLVAKGERIDALERQLRTRSERIDAWSRRLDTRSERLDLMEKRTEAPKAPPAAAPPAAVGEAPAKEKAVFVTVVKSPTAIVKERSAAPGAQAPISALHPGVAVEKAVAAATVLMFPTPASQISELDREALTGIAKLAAKENCELLIWARAKDPGLMSEARRRAAELQTLLVAAGPLDPQQVVTRITTRPGAQGVDVVVSALRETRPAPAPEAPPQASSSLLSGESGKRQIREAVQAAQRSIEGCVGALIETRKLQKAEGVLKLTVSDRGVVMKVTTGEGAISGNDVEACLTAASKGWIFPPTEGEYVVDVPITVIRGASK